MKKSTKPARASEPRPGRVSQGFSLVEVTMALGVVSFAVLAVMGLLPVGLSNLRQSMDQTVEAQIVQAIAAQSVVARFTGLATGVQYFDDEGLPTDAGQDARYTANVTVTPPAYPGSTNSTDIGSSLATVRIRLDSRQESKFFTLQVANAGK
jgi:uncharacterized protein (TIGR02598 family)